MDIALLDKKVDLTEGQWVSDIPGNDSLRLLVRSSNYKPFRIATAGLARRSAKELSKDEGLMDFTIHAGEAQAQHLLLDWDGVKANGKPIKFDAALALKLLTADDDHGIGNKFRRAVEYAADQVAVNLAADTREAAGN